MTGYDPAAVRLQLLLATRGFDPGPVDGIAGPKTQRAMMRAAKSAKLSNPTPKALMSWLRKQVVVHVIVQRVSTPVGATELREALFVAHPTIEAGNPEPCVRMAHAHLLVEHGPDGAPAHGLRAVHTFNLGNVMTGHGYDGPWFDMTAIERDRYGNMVPRLSHWRASAEPAEGAARYWAMLMEHFPTALAVMDEATPEQFAHALKLGGYYTAREGDYAALLRQMWEMVG